MQVIKKKTSITSTIIRLVTLLILAALLMTGFLTILYSTYLSWENSVNHLSSIAQLKKELLQSMYEEQIKDIVLLSRQHQITTIMGQLKFRQNDLTLPETSIKSNCMLTIDFKDNLHELFLMNRSGIIIWSSNIEQIGKIFSNRDYFNSGLKKIFVTNIYHSLTSGGPSLTISAPIFNKSGDILGVIAGRIVLADMFKMIEDSSGLGRSGESYLVNYYNYLVTRPRLQTDWSEPAAVYSRGIEECLAKKSGHALYKNYRGIPVLGIYRWVDEYHLGLIVEQSLVEVLQPVAVMSIGIILIILILIATLHLSLVRMTRKITSPLTDMAVGTIHIGKGNLDYRFAVGFGNELDELATCLNTMSRNLQATMISKEFLNNIMESMFEGLAVVTSSGIIQLVNCSFCSLTGLNEESLIGSNIGNIFSRINPLLEQCNQMSQNVRPPSSWEDTLYSKTGKKIPTLCSISPVIDSIKGSNVYVLVIKNITERKKQEIKLKRSRKKIKNYSMQLETVREQERLKIAREIHDELGQTLTMIKIELFRLTAKFSDSDNPVKMQLEELTTVVSNTIQVVKRISLELHPALLNELGLVAAMEWKINQIRQTSDISLLFNKPEYEIVLPEEQSIAVYRIFQESLTNVIKHSGADLVTISLEKRKNKIYYSIRDNGSGIDKQKKTNNKSLGIISMRERAEFLGGMLKIISSKKRGTMIKLIIPDAHGGE